ncbi:VOC family protein [Microbacterium sp. 22215]|uniref:VOC family protein n=1 Tax=Microbacterium sp. 22215 TaxID=3453893 RepID=UPI003F8712BB
MTTPLSHLAYLEIGSPDTAASAEFYTQKFGMRILKQDGDTYYLRCWGDHYPYSLVISPGEDAALKTMAWRTSSDADLDAAVARIEATDYAGSWSPSGLSRGRAYSFDGPLGHNMTLFWEIEHYEAEPELASVYPDRPEKRSLHAAAPRFLDHVTIAATDVKRFGDWYSETLGFRVMAYTTLEEVPLHVFGVLTTNEKSHDLGIVLDTSDTPGRVHHIAFWVDHPEDLVRTAEIMTENGVPIEYGPSIHGIGEQHFLYFRDPSTLRVELNSGGYRNYVPDWQARTWKPSDGSNSFFRNWNMPDSMMEAFPAAAGRTATEQGVHPELKEELLNPWATTTDAR